MYTGKIAAIQRSDTSLPVSGVGVQGIVLSDVFQAGPTDLMKMMGGFTMVRGFVNADVNGTLDIYQGWNLTDINAITPTVPAVATGNGRLFLRTFNFVSVGAANPGTPYLVAIVAPFVRVRFTNNALAPQTIFRIHFEAAE